MIKAIIFDMDGLLFDTESAYSVVQSAMSKKRGKEFTSEIKKPMMGQKAHEVMRLLSDFFGKGEKVEDLLAEQDGQLVEVYDGSVRKTEGVDDIISFINKHGIRKCIGTSSRRFLVDILLNKFHLEKEFEFIISGDMAKNGKPDPEIYNLCVAGLELLPEECLVLEDSLNGVKAAISAECKVCAIPSEYTKSEDFSKADLICSSLVDNRLKEFILNR
ncbi:MAG: HAD family phosphatase [Patescibacteria group bacterium]